MHSSEHGNTHWRFETVETVCVRAKRIQEPLHICPRKLSYVDFVVEQPSFAKLSRHERVIHWLLKTQEPFMVKMAYAKN